MKSILTDIIGLAGFGLLVAGFYLHFGLSPTLMFSGVIICAGALLAGWRARC